MMRRAAARFFLIATLLACVVPLALAEELTERFVTLAEAPVLATPEQADWRELLADITAAEAAGDDVALLLARTYSQVGWHIRAVDAWEQHLASGGSIEGEILGVPDRERFQDALRHLAYAWYQQGLLDQAAEVYARWYELFPANTEALRWRARIAQEAGHAELATELWREVALQAPDDAGVQYFVTVSEEEREYGREASQAFRAGIAAFEAGDAEVALEHFLHATEANPDFEAPYEWVARAAAEAGQPAIAYDYWQRVLAEHPDDERAAWFVQLSRMQVRWGSAAANAYYIGVAAHDRGDEAEALQAFRTAYTAAPEWNRALEWYARVLTEVGQIGEALPLWLELTAREPNNQTARFYANQATLRERAGPEAANLYDAGVRADNIGDYRGAVTAFAAAVAIAPDLVEAWEQLGRLHFAAGEYLKAADAYKAALAVQPDNDDYAFFYEQALRLSQSSQQ